MIHFKMYMEQSQVRGQNLDSILVDYFYNSNTLKLEVHDSYLNEEHKIVNIFESLPYHMSLS